jgi:hypothetical protein
LYKDNKTKKLQNNKIQVHRVLRELFGRETTRFDLLAIIISSISFAILTLILNWNVDISILISSKVGTVTPVIFNANKKSVLNIF